MSELETLKAELKKAQDKSAAYEAIIECLRESDRLESKFSNSADRAVTKVN
jgi:hypothetical protein